MPVATPSGPQAEFETRLRFELQHWTAVTPAMLHSIDEKGRLISVSDAWLAKLGYTREEVLGRLSSEFLTAESREYAIRKVLPEFFRLGRCENVQYQMVRKDGSVIDVLLSAVLDDDPSGQGRISLAVITDVTALKEARRRLAESEARYRGLVEDQCELVSLATPEGELRYVNHAYALFHGKQPEEMVGRNLYEFVPPDNNAALTEHLRKVAAARHGIEDKNQVVMPNGKRRWLAWTNRAVTDDDGRVTGIHSVGRDIDEQVRAEQRLQEREAHYRLLADNSTDMVFQLDQDLVRRYVSPACRELLGYEPEEMIGIKPVSMAHPEDAPRLMLVFQTLMSGHADRHSIINRIRHRNGNWVWVEAQFRALKDPETGVITGVIGALRDISDRKAVEDELADANRRLQALAGQDGLTGLANRRIFDEALAKEFRRAARKQKAVSLIMIDVDRFKIFNDRYGHPAGDDCLRRVAAVIAGTARRPGDVVARYGGEEFAVLLPDTDEAGAELTAQRVLQAVRGLKIRHEGGPNGVVTISAGIASLVPAELDSPAEILIENADRALYRAKDSGRNTVIRASAMAPNQAATSRRPRMPGKIRRR